jgi:hypothetical protein
MADFPSASRAPASGTQAARPRERVRAIFILSKSIGELLGPDHHVARAIRTAADDESPFNFELARTAFDRLPGATRRRIRGHAESEAERYADAIGLKAILRKLPGDQPIGLEMIWPQTGTYAGRPRER